MDYKLRYNEATLALAVDTDGDKQFTATIGDTAFDVAFDRVSDNRLHLTVNGRQTTAYVADTSGGKAVTINGRTWLLEDESARSARPSGSQQKGPKTVTPPMPAVVTKILVEPGESVEKGQGLLVVSAMKMDTTLAAPFDGVVSQINCAEGDKVKPKQILVDFEAVKSDETENA